MSLKVGLARFGRAYLLLIRRFLSFEKRYLFNQTGFQVKTGNLPSAPAKWGTICPDYTRIISKTELERSICRTISGDKMYRERRGLGVVQPFRLLYSY